MSVQKVFLCPLLGQPRHSGVSLESPGLENIPPVPGNRAELAQNHDARKAGSATLLVLKSSGAMCWPRSFEVSVEKVLPFPLYCKPRQSGVSLKFPSLENIPQLPGNRGVVCQNHDSHKAVSATLSVLK